MHAIDAASLCCCYLSLFSFKYFVMYHVVFLFKGLVPTGLRAKAADDVGDLHSSVASPGPQHPTY